MNTLHEQPGAYHATWTPSPALLQRARQLQKEFPQCFVPWNPDSEVISREDLRLVVQELRDWGNHKAWRAAQELHQCL